MKRFYIKIILIITILCVVFIGLVYGVIYKCSHNENYLYYGNDEYRFVSVYVGSGRSTTLYCGVIKFDDYEKWLNGEAGTIFIYSTTKENYGNRVNISAITNIVNYGSLPKFLPMNFW